MNSQMTETELSIDDIQNILPEYQYQVYTLNSQRV